MPDRGRRSVRVGTWGTGILEPMGHDTASVITLTEKAARRIRTLAEKEGHAQPILRVRVVAGGCSGFSYELGFADAVDAADEVVEVDGVRVLIDPRSAPIVAGSTLEFDDALLGGGLKMLNPLAKHECACGESFSI
jgi:iron-sulfur cluster assembly accessory protein